MTPSEQVARKIEESIAGIDQPSLQTLSRAPLSSALWLSANCRALAMVVAPRQLVVPDIWFGGNIAQQTIAFLDDLVSGTQKPVVVGVTRGPGSMREPGSRLDFSFFGINELVKVEVSSAQGVANFLDEHGRVPRGMVLVAVLEIERVQRSSTEACTLKATAQTWLRFKDGTVEIRPSGKHD